MLPQLQLRLAALAEALRLMAKVRVRALIRAVVRCVGMWPGPFLFCFYHLCLRSLPSLPSSCGIRNILCLCVCVHLGFDFLLCVTQSRSSRSSYLQGIPLRLLVSTNPHYSYYYYFHRPSSPGVARLPNSNAFSLCLLLQSMRWKDKAKFGGSFLRICTDQSLCLECELNRGPYFPSERCTVLLGTSLAYGPQR